VRRQLFGKSARAGFCLRKALPLFGRGRLLGGAAAAIDLEQD
jgi:hypothetical protein